MFSNVQIVHKFAGYMTLNLCFKVTIILESFVENTSNGTRLSYIYNDRLAFVYDLSNGAIGPKCNFKACISPCLIACKQYSIDPWLL